MAEEPVISVQDVGKTFRMYHQPQDRLKQMLFRRFGKSWGHDFHALQSVSFEIHRGESMGIVGRNGSGKSTLLQIIAGTMQPSTGTVKVRGRIAALLELGSGFNPEFTGRENVYLNASILGLSQQEIDERFPEIASFADIGEFMEQPVKTYSSGMLIRLGFAVQVQIEPDILIVDEALAVGDALFQKRCYQQMERLTSRGTTLLFVSHDQESVRTLTDRALLLNRGQVTCYGTSAEVILAYRKQLHEEEQAQMVAATQEWGQKAQDQALGARSDRLAFGDQDVEVLAVTVLDGNGEETNLLFPSDRFAIAITCHARRDATHLNVAFRLRNKQGIKITSWGTLNEQVRRRADGSVVPALWDHSFRAGDRFTVRFEGECRLGPNFYEIQATVAELPVPEYGDQRILHWKDEAAFFTVHHRPKEYVFGGICDMGLTATIDIHPAGGATS